MIKTECIGNLGKDAETKTIGGNSYASFSIAVSERVKGENKTTWYHVLKLDKEGKLTGYLTKGIKIWISGKPVLSAYINKSNGNAVADMTIWANELEFCSSIEQNRQTTPHESTINNTPPIPDDDDLPF